MGSFYGDAVLGIMQWRQEVALEEREEYFNPMDSVVRNTVTYNRLGEVYCYLTRHPEFVLSSDSVGYRRSGAGNDDSTMLWKDCEGLRVYTIPEDSHRASYHINFIQFINDGGRIDSTLLEDNAGGVVGFVSLKGRDGKTYFLVKTDLYYGHQGTAKCERICAFSIQGNRLVKEKLFHARGFFELRKEKGEWRMENHPDAEANSQFLIPNSQF